MSIQPVHPRRKAIAWALKRAFLIPLSDEEERAERKLLIRVDQSRRGK